MDQESETQVEAIWRAMDIVCDTPVLLILESAWLGTRRFDQFQQTTGLMKVVVSRRLKSLVECGIFYKHAYCERPARYEYRFTDMGLDLFPVALMMLRWEQKWSDPNGRIKVSVKHRDCDKVTTPICCCSHCNAPVLASDVARDDDGTIGTTPKSYVKRRRQAGIGESNRQTMLFEDISEIFGDRWAALVVRAAFMGERRYDGFLQATGASTNILTDRLKRLVEEGLFTRKAYQDNPPRYEYRLTEKAMDIYPMLLFLLDWGERWFSRQGTPSMKLRHTPCNRALKPVVCCSECSSTLTMQNIELRVSD